MLDLRVDMFVSRLRIGLALIALSSPLYAQGVGARATPNDYQNSAKAGNITIAADFDAHSVPTAEAVFSSEDFVVFDVGFFGPAGAHLVMKPEDFTMQILKGKKKVSYPAQPYALVFHSLKDPEWEQQIAVEKATQKTTVGSGSGGGGGLGSGGIGAGDPPPPTPRMPIGTERKMEQRVQKAAMPEGDRPLPQGGLIFFQYHGKPAGMTGLELVYSGAAGKVSIPLQP